MRLIVRRVWDPAHVQEDGGFAPSRQGSGTRTLIIGFASIVVRRNSLRIAHCRRCKTSTRVLEQPSGVPGVGEPLGLPSTHVWLEPAELSAAASDPTTVVEV